MSRYQGWLGGLDLTNYVGKESDFLIKVIGIRDHLRTRFDVASGQRTRVGDVFRWAGSTAASSMYGFQIRHYNGSGVLTGHEFTLLFPWFDSTQYIGFCIGLRNSPRFLNHFRRYDNNAAYNNGPKLLFRYFDKMDLTARYQASGTSGTISVSDPVHLQSDPTITGVVSVVDSTTDIRVRQVAGRKLVAAEIWEVSSGANVGSTFTISSESEARFLDIGYDNHALMTMSSDGADISGWSPYTNEDDFFYDRTTEEPFPGVYLLQNTVGSENEFHEIAYDDTIPCMTLAKTGRLTRSISDVALAGAIIEPYDDPADTEINGIMLLGISSDSSNTGFLGSHWISSRYHVYGGGGGLFTNMALSFDNTFTISNELDGSGEFLKQRMGIYNTNEVKGWLKKQVGFVVGAYQERVYQPFSTADGEFMKFTYDFALAWHDQVGLPYVRWDLEQPFPIG